MTKVDTLVQFCDVVKHFGATTALDRISLDIQPAASSAGRLQWAGKSTLLRHIIGLYLRMRGRVPRWGLRPAGSARRNLPGSAMCIRKVS
jgi:ABC-type sugar transport system ATPase subunit